LGLWRRPIQYTRDANGDTTGGGQPYKRDVDDDEEADCWRIMANRPEHNSVENSNSKKWMMKHLLPLELNHRLFSSWDLA
jgi:hypothetical protein